MILVFGKTGQVSKEIQIIEDVIAIGRDIADLSNPSECKSAIKNYLPSVVINAAAYTDVDKAEQEESLATSINGHAPTVMAKTCSNLNIPFIHISSDYVFNGMGSQPWQSDDNPSPQNAYGRSKLIGEIGIKNSGANYVILRTSWVVSKYGNNFIKAMLTLSEKRNVLNIVADQIGGPTPAYDIALACLEIAKQLKNDSSKSNTYHFSGYPDVSWAEFAFEIFKQVKKDINIIPIPSTDYPTPAPRPLNSRMDCRDINKIFGIQRPDWRLGLKNILKDLEVKL